MMSNTKKGVRSSLTLGGLGAALVLQVAVVGVVAGLSLAAQGAGLATQLGVSAVMAERLMNVLNSWYFTILIGIATGGWGAALVRAAVAMATRWGKRYAIAW